MRFYFYAILTMFFWGISPALEKIGVSKLSPLTAVSIRSFFVAIILSVFFFSSGGLQEATKDPRSLAFILLGGLFAGLLGQLTYFSALKYGEASRVVPIVASYPVLTFIIGITLLGESLTMAKVAGVVLVSAGVFLLR